MQRVVGIRIVGWDRAVLGSLLGAVAGQVVAVQADEFLIGSAGVVEVVGLSGQASQFVVGEGLPGGALVRSPAEELA